MEDTSIHQLVYLKARLLRDKQICTVTARAVFVIFFTAQNRCPFLAMRPSMADQTFGKNYVSALGFVIMPALVCTANTTLPQRCRTATLRSCGHKIGVIVHLLTVSSELCESMIRGFVLRVCVCCAKPCAPATPKHA